MAVRYKKNSVKRHRSARPLAVVAAQPQQKPTRAEKRAARVEEAKNRGLHFTMNFIREAGESYEDFRARFTRQICSTLNRAEHRLNFRVRSGGAGNSAEYRIVVTAKS